MSTAALVPPAWRALLVDVLRDPRFGLLLDAVASERARGLEILPPAAEVFSAFASVAPEDVRVVILGQDPYPTPGHAHGLAFSYRGAGALPRSLRNIHAEIARDLHVDMTSAPGDLTPWAVQGVLLLNTVLTVRAGEAGSHRGLGWAWFVDAVLDALAAAGRPLVVLLWGREARRRASRFPAPHTVLEAGHPSPLSVRHFTGCAHFSQTNAHVRGAPIDWAAIARVGTAS